MSRPDGATPRDWLVDTTAEILGCTGSDIRDTDTLDSLDADSLDRLELLMVAGDNFDVSIDDDEAAAIRTFGDMVSLIERKLPS